MKCNSTHLLFLSLLFLTLTAGCSQQSDLTSSGENQHKAVLHVFNWNNYIAPETIKRFEALCQCKVSQDYYSDNEEMLAKLSAGATGYDLVVPTGNAMSTMIRQNTLRPLDKSQLANLKNITPAYLNTEFDPANIYSVPYAFTITLLGFNENKLNELNLPTDTWAIIFEPKYLKKIKGRVTVLDSQRELMAAALKYLGYSANDTNEAHWTQAANLIIRAKPYWAAFNNNSYIRELALGNIWVAHGYSNDMYQAALDVKKTNRPFTVDYATPKEGAILALDSIVLHKDGKQPELSHQFINFMMVGKNAAELTNLIGSGNPNKEALSHIRPELLKNKAIFPDPMQPNKLEMLVDLDHKQRRRLSRIWTKIKLQ